MALPGFTIPNASKDLGPAMYDGKQVEHFQWVDVILKIIKMSTTDL